MSYEVPMGEGETAAVTTGKSQGLCLWEVFVRSDRGLNHTHVGSLHAADAATALRNARDVYTRRAEGVSIWVVASNDIHASDPDRSDDWFDSDKPYRHPTFYEIPNEVGHM